MGSDLKHIKHINEFFDVGYSEIRMDMAGLMEYSRYSISHIRIYLLVWDLIQTSKEM